MSNAQTSIKTVGVLGAGQMGCGIAQNASQCGFEVLLVDQNHELAEKGRLRVGAQLKKLVEKGKLVEADAQKVMSGITAAPSFEALAKADLVIEAIAEIPELKYSTFKKLDAICAPHVILASNTSSISLTAIAAQTKRPSQVAGMHFMNPVPVMKLVEGIRGLQTSEATFSAIRWVAEKMGKTFIEAKDLPGFAVNRILMPMINEAITALHEGVASVQDIDTAMQLGTHQPMGPLTLADFIGLDTCLAIMNVLHEGLGDSKYRACPLLKNYVAAGWLGKKTGRGFHHYDTQ